MSCNLPYHPTSRRRIGGFRPSDIPEHDSVAVTWRSPDPLMEESPPRHGAVRPCHPRQAPRVPLPLRPPKLQSSKLRVVVTGGSGTVRSEALPIEPDLRLLRVVGREQTANSDLLSDSQKQISALVVAGVGPREEKGPLPCVSSERGRGLELRTSLGQPADRVARVNDQSQWEVVEVPELRIVEQEVWERAKARQLALASGPQSQSGGLNGTHRPIFLLSGLLKCGGCGGGYTVIGKGRYGCATRRGKGTCDNSATITRQSLERRVLGGLRERMLTPDSVAAFVREFECAASSTSSTRAVRPWLLTH